ncbi:MAG: type II toxin-antitoxin system PemK/MazF family toxin [Spirochaetaceae bacterium]|nr:type II toxin-antitoxin system PemK/MazF family toxin [Spirochaetaceae bacterium]
MALLFPPHPGTFLMCDFNTGFEPPEMTKRRPVVVISPRPKNRVGLCTVVPLSTAAPNPVRRFHYLMAERSLPPELRGQDSWAKCDMLCTVSLRRLDWVSGRRALRVLDEDLVAIRRCVAVALGLDVGGDEGA